MLLKVSVFNKYKHFAMKALSYRLFLRSNKQLTQSLYSTFNLCHSPSATLFSFQSPNCTSICWSTAPNDAFNWGRPERTDSSKKSDCNGKCRWADEWRRMAFWLETSEIKHPITSNSAYLTVANSISSSHSILLSKAGTTRKFCESPPKDTERRWHCSSVSCCRHGQLMHCCWRSERWHSELERQKLGKQVSTFLDSSQRGPKNEK